MGRFAYGLVLLAAGAWAQPYELPSGLVGDREALLEFATAAEERGDWDLAADALSEIEEPDAATRVRLAKALYRSGPEAKPEAFRIAFEVAESETESRDAEFLVGLMYLEQDLVALAEERFQVLAESTPQDDALFAPLSVVRAAATLRRGDVVRAEALLATLGAQGAAYDVETRDLLRRSIFIFERDRHTFPDTAEHHDAWAHLLYRAGRLPDAIQAGRRAANLDAGDTEKWTFLGAMFAQLGQAEEALNAYERALELEPENEALREAVEQMRG